MYHTSTHPGLKLIVTQSSSPRVRSACPANHLGWSDWPRDMECPPIPRVRKDPPMRVYDSIEGGEIRDVTGSDSSRSLRAFLPPGNLKTIIADYSNSGKEVRSFDHYEKMAENLAAKLRDLQTKENISRKFDRLPNDYPVPAENWFTAKSTRQYARDIYLLLLSTYY
nr:hypothetical protein HmN_000500900 [Hymenolepis microstoma]